MVVAEVVFVYGVRCSAIDFARLIDGGYVNVDLGKFLTPEDKSSAPLPVTEDFLEKYLALDITSDLFKQVTTFIEDELFGYVSEIEEFNAEKFPNRSVASDDAAECEAAKDLPGWNWGFHLMPHEARWTDYKGDSIYFGLVMHVEFAPLPAFPTPPPSEAADLLKEALAEIGLEPEYFAMPQDCNWCS